MNAIDLGVSARFVAQLIGLDLVENFAELPIGFRLNWDDARNSGRFDGCETIGALELAYCDYVCRNLPKPQRGVAPDVLAVLLSSESFMAGFEGDETQDGMDERLAALRCVIAEAEGRNDA